MITFLTLPSRDPCTRSTLWAALLAFALSWLTLSPSSFALPSDMTCLLFCFSFKAQLGPLPGGHLPRLPRQGPWCPPLSISPLDFIASNCCAHIYLPFGLQAPEDNFSSSYKQVCVQQSFLKSRLVFPWCLWKGRSSGERIPTRPTPGPPSPSKPHFTPSPAFPWTSWFQPVQAHWCNDIWPLRKLKFFIWQVQFEIFRELFY